MARVSVRAVRAQVTELAGVDAVGPGQPDRGERLAQVPQRRVCRVAVLRCRGGDKHGQTTHISTGYPIHHFCELPAAAPVNASKAPAGPARPAAAPRICWMRSNISYHRGFCRRAGGCRRGVWRARARWRQRRRVIVPGHVVEPGRAAVPGVPDRRGSYPPDPGLSRPETSAASVAGDLAQPGVHALESSFATVRHRTKVTKGPGLRAAGY